MNEEIEFFFKYFFQDFSASINDPANVTHKLILSALLLVGSIAILKLCRRIIFHLIENVKYSNMVYKTFQAVLSFMTLLILFSIWIKVQKSILLVLIIFGLIIALSIKNLSTNLVAWLMLIRKNYFKLYDRIEVQGIQGDVIKITPFYFKVVERGTGLSSSTATGRVVHIPNHILLGNTVYNYNQFVQFNWGEVKYSITVDCDWQKALEIVKRVGNQYIENFLEEYSTEDLERAKRKLTLFDEELKLKTYVFIDETQIEIVAQYPVYYTNLAATKSMFNEQIITQLQEASGVELSGQTVHVAIQNE